MMIAFGANLGVVAAIDYQNKKAKWDRYTREKFTENICGGTSLVVQWLRLHAPTVGGPGSIPGQGTRSYMLQLRACMVQIYPAQP